MMYPGVPHSTSKGSGCGPCIERSPRISAGFCCGLHLVGIRVRVRVRVRVKVRVRVRVTVTVRVKVRVTVRVIVRLTYLLHGFRRQVKKGIFGSDCRSGHIATAHPRGKFWG